MAQTKMAAGLLLSLPGVPMLYYGQEAGYDGELYATPNYSTTRTIRSYSTGGLFETYQHLARVRAAFPAFTEGDFAEVPVSPSSVSDQTYAFRRRAGDDNVLAVTNLGSADVSATLALSDAAMGFDPAATVYLNRPQHRRGAADDRRGARGDRRGRAGLLDAPVRRGNGDRDHPDGRRAGNAFDAGRA